MSVRAARTGVAGVENGAIALVVPGPIGQRTGGYRYDRRILEGLRAGGQTVCVHELAGRFPVADPPAREAAAKLVPRLDGALPVIDGLALPAFAPLRERLPRPWVALVHHPLPLETGLSEHERARLREVEASLLPEAARVVVTSPTTRRDLAAYEIEPARIGVVVPGTDPAPLARGGDGEAPMLLCVGALIPRKGHLVLIEALSALRDLRWRLVCCGSAARDPASAAAVRAAVACAGLDERVALLGEVEPEVLAEAYASADLLVSASFHEGYGMALGEALARGVPLVSTAGGAAGETVPEGAGLLVPPGDAEALAAALRRVLNEPDLRAALRAGAKAARQHLPTWRQQAALFAAELGKAALA
jgi:glycosyltransferase involved in cell wall biosynthesis